MVKKNKTKNPSKKSKSKMSFAWKKPLFALGAIIVLAILVVLAVKYMPDSATGQGSSTGGISDFTRCTKDKSCNYLYTKCVGSVRNCVGDAACTGRCLSAALKATVDKCGPKCLGKQCGSDSCGGNCGVCPTGQSCNVNSCVASVRCVDSDGTYLVVNKHTLTQESLLVKGTTRGIVTAGKKLNGKFEGSYTEATDECTPEGLLVEYHCNNGFLDANGITCPNIYGNTNDLNLVCYDGACKTKPGWCDSTEVPGIKVGKNITSSICAKRIIQDYNTPIDDWFNVPSADCLAIYKGVPITFYEGGYTYLSAGTPHVQQIGLEPCISQKGKTLEGAKTCIEEIIKSHPDRLSYYGPICD